MNEAKETILGIAIVAAFVVGCWILSLIVGNATNVPPCEVWHQGYSYAYSASCH